MFKMPLRKWWLLLLKRLPLRSAHLPGLVEEVVVALHMGRVSEYVVKLRPSARRLCRELSARHAMPVPCPITRPGSTGPV